MRGLSDPRVAQAIRLLHQAPRQTLDGQRPGRRLRAVSLDVI